MKKSLLILLLLPISILVNCSRNPNVRNDVKERIRDYYNSAIGYRSRGEFLLAKDYLEKALKETYIIDNLTLQIDILEELVFNEIDMGDTNKAIEYLQELDFLVKNTFTGDVNKMDSGSKRRLMKFYIIKGIVAEGQETLEYLGKAETFAVSTFEKAIVWNYLGRAYMKYGMLEKAIEYLQKAIEYNEKEKVFTRLADNYFNLGKVYELMGNIAKAIYYYEKALEMDKISENVLGIKKDLEVLKELYSKVDKDKALFYERRYENFMKAYKNSF